MNKLFKSIISIIGLSMAFAGCVGDFDDMNTDPNNPTPGSVDPKFQLIFIQQGRRQSVGKIRKTESKIILIIFQRRTGKRNTISQYICKYYRTRLTTYFIHTLRVNVNQSFGIAEPL